MAVIKKWNGKYGKQAEFLIEQNNKYCHYNLTDKKIKFESLDDNDLANYEDWEDFFDEQVEDIKDIEM